MDEIKAAKLQIRTEVTEKLARLPKDQRLNKTQQIETQLFEFANFLESKIVLMYMPLRQQVDTREMINRGFEYNKIIVLPAFAPDSHGVQLLKIDRLATDMIEGPRGIPEPNPARCKAVPLDRIDIAIIPAVALDEKGGRLGSGDGYYDRIIPKLPITARKVSLAFEDQIVPQVPMESHDKHVDIVITDRRIIYKI
jgi:5-formyltetrahydrofolate cyclo-ligase